MEKTAIVNPESLAMRSFFQNTVGKKVTMALSGLVLLSFLVIHMLGNLQIFSGADRINAYSELLHRSPLVLWLARIVLLLSILIHVIGAVQTFWQNWIGRSQRYTVHRFQESTFMARTMIWSGGLIALYVIYHLLHLTVGSAHPSFVEGDVYHNVSVAFANQTTSIIYIALMVVLGLHLLHGAFSLFQTLGINHPRINGVRNSVAKISSVILVIGFAIVPISILLGWVG